MNQKKAKALQNGLVRLFEQSGCTPGERLVVIARLMCAASRTLVPIADDEAIGWACMELGAGMDEIQQWMLRQGAGGNA